MTTTVTYDDPDTFFEDLKADQAHIHLGQVRISGLYIRHDSMPMSSVIAVCGAIVAGVVVQCRIYCGDLLSGPVPDGRGQAVKEKLDGHLQEFGVCAKALGLDIRAGHFPLPTSK